MRKTAANPTYKETVFYSPLQWLLKSLNRTANKKDRTRLMVFGDSNSYRPGNTTDSWPSKKFRIIEGAVREAKDHCNDGGIKELLLYPCLLL